MSGFCISRPFFIFDYVLSRLCTHEVGDLPVIWYLQYFLANYWHFWQISVHFFQKHKQVNRFFVLFCLISMLFYQIGKTFWGVVSAAVEQSRRKANKVAQGDGYSALEADPRIPPNQKINAMLFGKYFYWLSKFMPFSENNWLLIPENKAL